MPQLLRFTASLSIVLLSLGSAQARDKDQIPPATAKPLSEIVRSLEAEGHNVITDIDFDDWVWVVRAYKRGLEFEIRVDPVSGEILGIRPD
jgi:hypothetical protein